MTMEYNFVRLLAYWTIIFGCMVHRCTYTRTYPIILSVPNPLHFRNWIRDMIYPTPNPQPVIIRSGPNPMKKYGIGYDNDKIRSDPIRLHP